MVPTLRADVSLDTYLEMNFEQECELIAGELRAKPMGTVEHSDFELDLGILLREEFGRARAKVEFSIRRGEDVLVPDVCVLRAGTPKFYRRILDEAPLLCVEIVSPSQRPGELFVKCEMYHEWGDEFCWVVDPVAKRAWTYHAGTAAAVEVFDALTGPMTLALAEIFQ